MRKSGIKPKTIPERARAEICARKKKKATRRPKNKKIHFQHGKLRRRPIPSAHAVLCRVFQRHVPHRQDQRRRPAPARLVLSVRTVFWQAPRAVSPRLHPQEEKQRPPAARRLTHGAPTQHAGGQSPASIASTALSGPSRRPTFRSPAGSPRTLQPLDAVTIETTSSPLNTEALAGCFFQEI